MKVFIHHGMINQLRPWLEEVETGIEITVNDPADPSQTWMQDIAQSDVVVTGIMNKAETIRWAREFQKPIVFLSEAMYFEHARPDPTNEHCADKRLILAGLLTWAESEGSAEALDEMLAFMRRNTAIDVPAEKD